MEDPFLFERANAVELFIVRHADAIPGPEEIIPSGVYDDLPLSRIGREQAQALAERLGKMRFDAIYSSPLRRCLETAAPLAEQLRLTPIVVEDLKEIRLGEVNPIPRDGNDLAALYAALQKRQIDIVRIAGETGHWDAIPGSEPSQAFRKRVVDAIDGIANQHTGGRVLIFAHGGVVNAYAAEVLGLEKDFFFPAANTSITVVRVAGTHRVLYILNDIGHIKRSMETT
ncbi:MAG TPA: histidine phosphatase family protein [Ktedonobacteraceae bacterium]|jgi:probable phosphoglycerate mutase|nr:histidine phosphatase family protein [Ktedonobacteraceae bacterium]